MPKNLKSTFFKLTGVKVRSVDEINGGNSNLNYKVNDSYVLRMPPIYRDPILNYKNEYNVYEAIKDLGISEKISYFNIQTGIKISRFVHNARPYISYPSKIEINFVAKTLKKLHSSKIKVSNTFNFEEALKIYKKDLPQYFIIDKTKEEKIINNYLARVEKDPLVLCHNHLSQNDLLFKYNNVVIIDWEHASMNSAYYDLACFISENNLNKDDEITFLSKYFGSTYTKTKQNIVQIYLAAYDLLTYYWAQHMFVKKGDSIYITIAADKLRRLNYYTIK